jgi:hypothetical protein
VLTCKLRVLTCKKESMNDLGDVSSVIERLKD